MTRADMQKVRDVISNSPVPPSQEESEALRILDAALAAEPQPVAWMDEFGNTFPFAAKQYSDVGRNWKPLYTTPAPAPQREWVPLDSDDLLKLPGFDYDAPQFIAEKQFVQAVDAALKEKNHG